MATDTCCKPAEHEAIFTLFLVGTGRWRRIILMAVLVVALGALFAPVAQLLVVDWIRDPNYSHGFVIPLVSVWIIGRQLPRYRQLPWRPSNVGVGLMLAGLGMLVVGTAGAELFISRLSLLVFPAGMLLFLAGWPLLRAMIFPLGYLLFMIPLPALIQNQVTLPLQLIASRLAASCLELVGIPVLREGNLLFVPEYSMEVVEACSGIRSLISLLAIVVGYAYLAERRWRVRLALVVLVFPVAVAANGLRVFGTGVLGYCAGPGWADGFFHSFSGWLVFVTALALILGTHRGLSGLAGRWRRNPHA